MMAKLLIKLQQQNKFLTFRLQFASAKLNAKLCLEIPSRICVAVCVCVWCVFDDYMGRQNCVRIACTYFMCTLLHLPSHHLCFPLLAWHELIAYPTRKCLFGLYVADVCIFVLYARLKLLQNRSISRATISRMESFLQMNRKIFRQAKRMKNKIKQPQFQLELKTRSIFLLIFISQLLTLYTY